MKSGEGKMNDPAHFVRLRRLVDIWSDAIYKDSEEFSDKYQNLFAGKYPPLGKAQLYGLSNVVCSAPGFSSVSKFLNRQRDKALRRVESGGRQAETYQRVAEFWGEMESRLRELYKKAQSLLEQAHTTDWKSKDRTEADALHREMAAEYVHHLIAHAIYLSAQRSDNDNKEPARQGRPRQRSIAQTKGGSKR
jgi:hypothetical protein